MFNYLARRLIGEASVGCPQTFNGLVIFGLVFDVLVSQGDLAEYFFPLILTKRSIPYSLQAGNAF